MNMEKTMLLEMKNICKSFPGVRANWNIDFSVRHGEVHALLGENGAGKSTLMNILYGLYQPDEGEIWWKGKQVKIQSPKHSIDLGIGMVHQHFMLVPKLSVVENTILGIHKDKKPGLDLKKAAEEISVISKSYGLNIEPWAKVEDLSVGEQQRVEIVKALYRGAELLIMDEPTAVLTPSEVKDLFTTLSLLQEQDRSIVFISHKLDEVLSISDRVSILRDGTKVNTLENSADLNKSKLAYMMVGREVDLSVDKFPCNPGENVLQVENLKLVSPENQTLLDDLSFTIHQGEVFGIAGVDGNGQAELSEVVMGLQRVNSGSIKLNGIDITKLPSAEIRKLSLAYIPEDRHGSAMVTDFSIADNLVLNKIDSAPFSSGLKIDRNAIDEFSKTQIENFRIATPNQDTLISKLSGGNQQKVVLAREMHEKVDLIIAVQPTRGLDIDATRFVFDTILTARDNRTAVLYISTELEEVLAMSDRIGVIYKGKFMGIIDAASADLAEIGLMMAGVETGSAQTQETL